MASATIGSKLLSNFHESLEERIAEYRGWYSLQAIAFVASGIAAMVLPLVTGLGFDTQIGTLLLLSGTVKGIASLKSHVHWWSFLSAGLLTVIGVLMLLQPSSGFIALATLVAVLLLADGLTEIFLALEFESARNWGWLMVSGIVSVTFSIVLFVGWPGMTLAFLAVMVGVSLLLYGASLLAMLAATPRLDTL